MKAIVILFEGDYVSNARKDVTIQDIANAMTQHIKIESDNLKIVDFEDVDVELHYGGQPLYYYLISVE